MHSYDVFRQYERHQWQLADLPFDEIDRDLVDPDYVTLAKSAVMGESNSIAAQHGFFNEFVDDYDFSAFVAIWGFQELQHHYAFRAWLEALDIKVDTAPVEAMREPYAPGTTPAATLATNIISELTVNHVYRAVSDWVAEPILRTIMRDASRDEAAHAREFIHFARRRLATHPQELPSVLETLYVYTSGAQIKHPVSVFKSELPELREHETIDTGFEFFLAKVGGTGELDRLQVKIRRAFGALTGLDLASNARIRRALAEALT
ncbi:ferritin-like domain-containing protein [Candidatus Protofrankia californiensis]|uniref:ferritin-like domain-containing protein n=1 Tax=Candidatus Protofrankia californiensis TaxID=1839754 RepID=UPI001040E130|nr:ferritin-like domain-containing protein [Candidatus Protofrankia californiensis]